MTPQEFRALSDEHGGLVPVSVAALLAGVTYARIQQLVHTHGRLTPVVLPNGYTMFSLDEIATYHAERMAREAKGKAAK